MTGTGLAGEGLTFAYDGHTVLRAVDVLVAPGEIVGVIGPNGAGKTTLVRILAGVTRPTAGRVVLGERPLDTWSRRDRARAVAPVPQDPRVEFPFTVLEVVLMGRAPHLTGLASPAPTTSAAHARPARLDPPVSRRAPRRAPRAPALPARALAQDPAVLLSTSRRRTSTSAIRPRSSTSSGGVRERNLAALVVLHDLNLAAVACDRPAARRGDVAAGAPSDADAPLIEQAFATPVHVRQHDSRIPAILPLPTLRRTAGGGERASRRDR
jgi:iron complex transport system ATP-binding protein